MNSAHTARSVTVALHGLRASHVTPYLTDATLHVSPQTEITVSGGAFTATLPPRALVTYVIRS